MKGGARSTEPGLYKNSYSFHGPWIDVSLPSKIISGLPSTPVILQIPILKASLRLKITGLAYKLLSPAEKSVAIDDVEFLHLRMILSNGFSHSS